MNRFLAGLILLFMGCRVASAHESYRDWLATVPSGAAPFDLQFTPSTDRVSSFQTFYFDERPQMRNKPANQWDVPTRPAGGYIGSLRLRAAAKANLRFPLRVRLLYSLVRVDDLLPPAPVKPHNVAWSLPMHLVDFKSPIRASPSVEEWSLSESEVADGHLLPLILPRSPASRGLVGDNVKLLSCRCEVLDAAGHVLFRTLLVELFSVTPHYGREETAWVTGNDPEADRLLRECTDIGMVVTIKSLP